MSHLKNLTRSTNFRTIVVGLFLSMSLVVTQVVAQESPIPHTFLPNTPAKSSEVNENFQFLLDVITRTPLIDSTDAIYARASINAGSGFGNLITVDRDITVTGFAFNMELVSADGDLKFVIFEDTGPTLVWEGTPQPFPLDTGTPTWKRSENMCFVLEQGKTYKMGAMVNVDASWPYEFTVNTDNGITVLSQNQNFHDFDNPWFTGAGSVNFWQRIYGITYIAANCL
jgi:hypothetical protein